MEQNWRDLLNDDKNFDQKVPYDLKKIEDNMKKAQADLTHFNPYYVLSPVYDFTKFFDKISSALSMGFKDITEKVDLMRKILKDYPEVNDIQTLIEKEISLNIHKLTGENNAKLGHKDDKYKKYVSAARTFLRLLWFMEFLISIFRKLLKEEDKSLKEILKSAYNEVLAPRHSGVVRTAVSVALTFSGGKKKEAIKTIFGYDEMNTQCREKIAYVADMLEKIWKAGYDFYEKKELLKLE